MLTEIFRSGSAVAVIRREQPADSAAVAEVNRLAFGQDNEAQLVAELRKAEDFDPTLSLVAVCDGEVVGHILFSAICIESQRGEVRALALAPMAVLPDYQRQGIGSALVREGLEACRRAGHRIVVVLGHAEYYPRFGFTPASGYGVKAPFSVPDEAFMLLSLASGGLDGISGVVCYPAAFSEV